MREQAEFDLAVRLRRGEATISEIYAFISGLYFRGKVAYVDVFRAEPPGISPAMVIVPGLGLVRPERIADHDQLRAIGNIPIDADNADFIAPFLRDAINLNREAGPDCRFVLLGSIASDKYTRTLLDVFGERLLFPEEFIGRGDMSRGGLMLRCAQAAQELSYIPVQGAVRRGRRPAKLEPLKNKRSGQP
jgi:hypothetical protein